MKYIILSLFFLLSGNVFANENSPQKGTCFLVKDGKPEIPKPCVVSSGGGAGGSYVQFKIGKTNVLIEESEDGVNIGNSPKTLKDGVNYMRDHKTLNIIPNNDESFQKFFCTRQKDGVLDACIRP